MLYLECIAVGWVMAMVRVFAIHVECIQQMTIQSPVPSSAGAVLSTVASRQCDCHAAQRDAGRAGEHTSWRIESLCRCNQEPQTERLFTGCSKCASQAFTFIIHLATSTHIHQSHLSIAERWTSFIWKVVPLFVGNLSELSATTIKFRYNKVVLYMKNKFIIFEYLL